jgi:hypothetical protein
MRGRVQSFSEEGPDVPKHHQIPWLSLVTEEMQAQPSEKQAVCSILAPMTFWQTREFLGAMGVCQIWIPNYSLLAKPLYEATRDGENGNPWYGERNKGKLLEKLRGHLQMPLL